MFRSRPRSSHCGPSRVGAGRRAERARRRPGRDRADGPYPPGSTFKTVTTSAALQAGRSPRTPCCRAPAPRTSRAGRSRTTTISISGRCRCTRRSRTRATPRWGAWRWSLPPDALQQAALQFGLGVDYVTPGLTTVTGTVPTAQTPSRKGRVRDRAGRGDGITVRRALVAASIAKGTTPAPTMIVGKPASPTAASPDARGRRRGSAVDDARDGNGRDRQDARRSANLEGKTGTAEYGEGTPHMVGSWAWMETSLSRFRCGSG
ncbi:hypothetical protein GS416_06635 [Rhodococcus hoagii]|nr:hypothetical protein [Prescottella equi]